MRLPDLTLQSLQSDEGDDLAPQQIHELRVVKDIHSWNTHSTWNDPRINVLSLDLSGCLTEEATPVPAVAAASAIASATASEVSEMLVPVFQTVPETRGALTPTLCDLPSNLLQHLAQIVPHTLPGVSAAIFAAQLGDLFTRSDYETPLTQVCVALYVSSIKVLSRACYSNSS